MTRRFRYAVIGGGGIGSATAYWLSKAAGVDVLCLEQWEPGHDRGASEDHSRIIRLGYHASRYPALTRDSYAAWQVAERESGVQLVRRWPSSSSASCPATAGRSSTRAAASTTCHRTAT